MVDITIEAPLPPRGKGRPRRGKNGVMFTPAATRQWEAQLAQLAQEQLPPEQLDGPIRVDILSAIQRTKPMCERYKRDNTAKGIVAGQCRAPEGMVWHTGKPDGDNVRKAVLDSLKAFWRDDSQVVSGETLTVYHELDKRPRVVVRIRTVEKDPNEMARELGLVD